MFYNRPQISEEGLWQTTVCFEVAKAFEQSSDLAWMSTDYLRCRLTRRHLRLRLVFFQELPLLIHKETAALHRCKFSVIKMSH